MPIKPQNGPPDLSDQAGRTPVLIEELLQPLHHFRMIFRERGAAVQPLLFAGPMTSSGFSLPLIIPTTPAFSRRMPSVPVPSPMP